MINIVKKLRAYWHKYNISTILVVLVVIFIIFLEVNAIFRDYHESKDRLWMERHEYKS